MTSFCKHLVGREGRDVCQNSPALRLSGWGGLAEMREAFLREAFLPQETSQGGLVWPPAQHSKAPPTQLTPSAKKEEKETLQKNEGNARRRRNQP